MKMEWKPPVPIPVGALLVVKRDRVNEIYPRMRILIYLAWMGYETTRNETPLP